MADEIELKLALRADQVDRLRDHPMIRSLAVGRATRRRLHSTYFDTPELDLAKQGWALRVRDIAGRHVQTLKIPIAGGGSLHTHREIECAVEGRRPDPTRIADGEARRFFARGGIADRLAPVFKTDVERQTLRLGFRGSDIELALDTGVIASRRRRRRVCEAELELKAGPRRRLYELALELHRSEPVALEARTKAERGYALALGKDAAPRRALPVRLAPDADAKRAFVENARDCLDQLRANAACVRLDGDPEGAHQMRVAVRRLRALVGCYRDFIDAEVHRYLSSELRWLQRRLGPAREWDVFIGDTLAPLAKKHPEDAAVAAMGAAAAALRKTAYRRAEEVRRAPRFTELVLRLELWLDGGDWAAGAAMAEPARAFAAAILKRRHKRLGRFGGKRGRLGVARLHRLRLLGKKSRYAVEFFRDLFPRQAARRYRRALIDIQTRLGSINDAAVNRHLLDALEKRLATTSPALARRAAEIVGDWEAARIERDRQGFEKTWRRFLEAEPFW